MDYPGGCNTVQEFNLYVHNRVLECMNDYKSKEETVSHLWDQYQIEPDCTNFFWDNLEQENPDRFRLYNAACEYNRRIREERDATIMETAPNVQRYAAASSRAPQDANEKPKLQAPHSQQPAFPPTEFWELLLTTLGEIKSNTEQIIKLITDGQGFGPHPSAAGSTKRQRGEKEQESGDNKDEAANLQDEEKGDNKEAENPEDQNQLPPQ